MKSEILITTAGEWSGRSVLTKWKAPVGPVYMEVGDPR